MITCKEDLINTYVDGSDKELSKLYQETAFKFGFDWLHFGDENVRHDDSNPIICCHECLKVSWERRGSDAFSGFKRLTLSDLKPTKQYAVLHKGGSYSFQSDRPIGNDVVACFNLTHSEKPLSEDFFDEKPRTNVEYEKVTESIFDLKDEFERGELWCKHEYASDYSQVINTQTLAQSLHGDYCFKRVETEIDERQEFIDAAFSVIEDYHGERRQYVVEALYDSGKFKLVN